MSPVRGGTIGLVAVLAAVVVTWSAGIVPVPAGLLPAHEAQMRDGLLTDLGRVSASGGAPESLRTQARTLAARSPLDATPYLVVGAIEEEGGKGPTADRLYTAALQRDPRSRGAHYLLAARALAKGEPDRALRHLASLARQTGSAGPEFSKLMLAVAADRSLDAPLRRFLAKEPQNREQLFSAMAADPALSGRLVELAPAHPSPRPPAWLSTLVDTEVRAGRIDRAADSWRRFAGQDVRDAALRDTKFRHVPGWAPFGWSVDNNDAGLVASGVEGLDVESYGRGAKRLVAQWLVLNPGRYMLRSTATGAIGKSLEWQLQCLTPSQRTLAKAPVAGQIEFDVPADCAAQALELFTRETEDGAPASGTLRAVTIEKR